MADPVVNPFFASPSGPNPFDQPVGCNPLTQSCPPPEPSFTKYAWQQFKHIPQHVASTDWHLVTGLGQMLYDAALYASPFGRLADITDLALTLSGKPGPESWKVKSLPWYVRLPASTVQYADTIRKRLFQEETSVIPSALHLVDLIQPVHAVAGELGAEHPEKYSIGYWWNRAANRSREWAHKYPILLPMPYMQPVETGSAKAYAKNIVYGVTHPEQTALEALIWLEPLAPKAGITGVLRKVARVGIEAPWWVTRKAVATPFEGIDLPGIAERIGERVPKAKEAGIRKLANKLYESPRLGSFLQGKLPWQTRVRQFFTSTSRIKQNLADLLSDVFAAKDRLAREMERVGEVREELASDPFYDNSLRVKVSDVTKGFLNKVLDRVHQLRQMENRHVGGYRARNLMRAVLDGDYERLAKEDREFLDGLISQYKSEIPIKEAAVSWEVATRAGLRRLFQTEDWGPRMRELGVALEEPPTTEGTSYHDLLRHVYDNIDGYADLIAYGTMQMLGKKLIKDYAQIYGVEVPPDVLIRRVGVGASLGTPRQIYARHIGAAQQLAQEAGEFIKGLGSEEEQAAAKAMLGRLFHPIEPGEAEPKIPVTVTIGEGEGASRISSMEPLNEESGLGGITGPAAERIVEEYNRRAVRSPTGEVIAAPVVKVEFGELPQDYAVPKGVDRAAAERIYERVKPHAEKMASWLLSKILWLGMEDPQLFSDLIVHFPHIKRVWKEYYKSGFVPERRGIVFQARTLDPATAAKWREEGLEVEPEQYPLEAFMSYANELASEIGHLEFMKRVAYETIKAMKAVQEGKGEDLYPGFRLGKTRPLRWEVLDRTARKVVRKAYIDAGLTKRETVETPDGPVERVVADEDAEIPVELADYLERMGSRPPKVWHMPTKILRFLWKEAIYNKTIRSFATAWRNWVATWPLYVYALLKLFGRDYGIDQYNAGAKAVKWMIEDYKRFYTHKGKFGRKLDLAGETTIEGVPFTIPKELFAIHSGMMSPYNVTDALGYVEEGKLPAAHQILLDELRMGQYAAEHIADIERLMKEENLPPETAAELDAQKKMYEDLHKRYSLRHHLKEMSKAAAERQIRKMWQELVLFKRAADAKAMHMYGYGWISHAPHKLSLLYRMASKPEAVADLMKRLEDAGYYVENLKHWDQLPDEAKAIVNDWLADLGDVEANYLPDYSRMPAGVRSLSNTIIPFFTWTWFSFGRIPRIAGEVPLWAATWYSAMKALEMNAYAADPKRVVDYWPVPFGLMPVGRMPDTGKLVWFDPRKYVHGDLFTSILTDWATTPGESLIGAIGRQIGQHPFIQGAYTLETGHSPYRSIVPWYAYLGMTHEPGKSLAKGLEIASPFLPWMPYWAMQTVQLYAPTMLGYKRGVWPTGTMQPWQALERLLTGGRSVVASPGQIRATSVRYLQKGIRHAMSNQWYWRRMMPNMPKRMRNVVIQEIRDRVQQIRRWSKWPPSVPATKGGASWQQ